MNVLVLHSELGVLRGGGENFTRNVFAAFVRRGHRVAAAFVADHRGCYPVALPPEIEPVPIKGWWSKEFGQTALSSMRRYLPAGGKYRKGWDRVQNAVECRTFRWHNRRFQRRIEEQFAPCWSDFDAIYAHGDTALANMAAKHRPTVLRLPGPVPAELASMLREVHAVCANGDALQRIREFLGDHATELPIGIDTQLFKGGTNLTRARLGWTWRHHVIGYVGRLTHLKGVDLLAEAFREICRAEVNARLLIVGSGAEEKWIQPLLAAERTRGLVHIEPHVSQQTIPEWYRAMDLLVMPSRYENFSNAILEAMACGVPFLASDVGGNKILGSSGAGWLFEAGSSSSLVQSLGKILKNKNEMRSRGKVGVDYVQRHHNWSITAARLEEIFRWTFNGNHA